jgi:hypothetical protein
MSYKKPRDRVGTTYITEYFVTDKNNNIVLSSEYEGLRSKLNDIKLIKKVSGNGKA